MPVRRLSAKIIAFELPTDTFLKLIYESVTLLPTTFCEKLDQKCSKWEVHFMNPHDIPVLSKSKNPSHSKLWGLLIGIFTLKMGRNKLLGMRPIFIESNFLK